MNGQQPFTDRPGPVRRLDSVRSGAGEVAENAEATTQAADRKVSEPGWPESVRRMVEVTFRGIAT